MRMKFNDPNYKKVKKERREEKNKWTYLAMMCFEPSILHPAITVY